MMPARQIPVTQSLPTATNWGGFKTHLDNWVAQVSQSFGSQILYQVPVTTVVASPPLPWTGTVPYTIAFAPPAPNTTDPQLQQGTAEAELVVDGMVQWFIPPLDNTGAPSVPGIGEWTIQTVQVLNPVTAQTEPTVVVVLSAAPSRHAWFSFLVAQ